MGIFTPCLVIKNVKLFDTMIFSFRAYFTSNVHSSYVQNVRIQQNIKRQAKHCTSHNDGQFLLLDCESNTVLLDRKESESTLLWNRFEDIQNLGIDVERESVFLTHTGSSCKFAVNVSSLESKVKGTFTNLRASLFILKDQESSLVSQSHSLLQWKAKHKFCVYCGGILENELYGAEKKCSSCKTTHYPSINPVGITLISNLNQSQVLLVRQPIHPPRMFTCVAGFIETGESIEENIRREIAEEVGLEVHSMQYVGSQHWSLQGSRLMIGCWATVKDDVFEIDSGELEVANWFTPKQLKSALERVHNRKDKLLMNPEDIWIPPPGALAHKLIKLWLEKYH